MSVPAKGRAIVVDEHLPDVYKAAQIQEFDIAAPKDQEVVIKFLAAPINPADILSINGFYPDVNPCPFIVGIEGVGEVLKTGAKVTTLQVGDRVLPGVKRFGTWRTHCVVPETNVVKIDKNLDFKDAATLFLNPVTAFMLLKDVVKLQPGDTVLQNGANSSVGKALIQLAKDMGFKTVNIIRKRDSAAEKKLKDELTALGADLVLNDEELKKREESAPWIGSGNQEMKEPVLLIDCVGGDSGTELTRHVAQSGTYCCYGALSGKPVQLAPGDLIFKNIRAVGFWMSQIMTERPDYVAKEFFPYIGRLIQEGKFKGPGYELFSIGDYQKAMKRHLDGYSNTKQLLVMDEKLLK